MALRTTEAAIREIFSTALTTPQLLAFATDANLWVTEELGSAGLTAARLELIERYLACHFARTREVAPTDVSVGAVSVTYQTRDTPSDYGQVAARLDPTGKIAATFIPEEDLPQIMAQFGTGYADE